MDNIQKIPEQEVSANLKDVRESRGLSLEAIFAKTRVSVVSLRAIENGDYSLLPPPVYTRNFIRKYALAVGIDAKPLLDGYERHLESLKPAPETAEIQKPWPETGRRYRPLVISLAAMIGIGILAAAVILHEPGVKPPAADPVPEPLVQEQDTPRSAQGTDLSDAALPAEASEPAPEPTGKPIPPPPAEVKTYRLVVEARELTWVRIVEDEKPPYQVLLKPGEKIERTATDHFQLDIGNAGGIDLNFQGKSLGAVGKRGQIVHMRLPDNGSE